MPQPTNNSLLSEIKSDLATMMERQKAQREIMDQVQSEIKEVTRALRGKNGEAGLIALVLEHDKLLQSVSERVGSLEKADAIFAETKRLFEENPPLTWLFRFRTKATLQTVLLIGFIIVWVIHNYGDKIAQWAGF